MGLRINTNVAALIGQRNIARTDRALSKSLERLSSGLRINHAADDPAGLAIAERQRAQIAGLNQAVENAERATSLVQTAEAALDEVNNILIHMRELVVDSANLGVNDANALAANQAEIDNALDTLDRIARDTAFGTKKLLDGSTANTVLFADGTNSTIYASFGTSTLATGTYRLRLYDVTDAGWTPESTASLTATGFTNNLSTDEQDVQGIEAGSHVVRVTQASTASSISGDVTLKDLSAGAEEFRLRVHDAAGSDVTSADLVLNADYSGSDTATLVNDINTAIANDANVADKVEAYVVDSDTIGFRTKSEGSASYVEILAPSDGTTALGAGAILSGFSDGDDSVNDGTQGTDAIVYLDDYANTVTYIEGDPNETATAVTLSDAATGGGSLKIEAGNSGLDVGNFVITVSAARGSAKLHTGASSSSNSGAAVSWTAEEAFTILDENGKSLRVTIGNNIKLDGDGAGTAYEDLTVEDNSLVFQVGGDRNQTVSLSLLDVASTELAKSVSNTSGFSSLADVQVGTAQQCADALLLIDQAIDEVTDIRAEIGSFQANTLESQLNNLRVAAENLTAARSSIVDADFAEEVSEFTKQQILLQTGMSTLSSAGSIPQLVLSLFR